MRQITEPIVNPVKVEEVHKAEVWPTFEDFWEAYDRKVKKVKAKAAWDRLGHEVHLQIMDHAPRYVKSTPEKKYRAHPTTYLNGQMWEDEILEDEQGISDDTRDFLIREILAGGR